MEETFILFKRIKDPYGCLEDNEGKIIGVFTTLEKALENKEIAKKRDLRKTFEFWIDNYKINELFI